MKEYFDSGLHEKKLLFFFFFLRQMICCSYIQQLSYLSVSLERKMSVETI